MDVSFSNVLEGTRQFFMGVPKQAAEGSGQSVWPSGAPPPEEGTPALSGVPAPSSRPPSAAAAPPSTPTPVLSIPPRPPSEPLEPEPHIIHKATVMREAAEKRREQPEPEDEEEAVGALSPPSHIIRKPTPRMLPSPAPAPAAPCPSPARPPSNAPHPPTTTTEHQMESQAQYRASVHRVQTPTARPPDHYAPGRPPDPYSASRPPEQYSRYQYESNINDGGRNSHGPPIASPQPSVPSRNSPQTYARMTGSLPQHSTSRLRDSAAHTPPSQRYAMPLAQPPPPHNDRVPPILHPQAVQPPQRLTPIDSRTSQAYPTLPQRRESSSYSRVTSHYDRHPTIPQRKYDPQQAYSGYRSPAAPQSIQSHRIESHHHQAQYKHEAMEAMNAHYVTRQPERAPVASQSHPHEVSRLPPRTDYIPKIRNVDSRNSYPYPTPSTSSVRYAPTTPAMPIAQNNPTLQSKTMYRSATAPKTSYDYGPSNNVQSSPSRSAVRPGYPSQHARMTVSVTTLVNQMNQTKQKRESPLDLSVKTVKNPADSSTTPDDIIESGSSENKVPLQSRATSNSRHVPPISNCAASHKVDFAPDFTQYKGERIPGHSYSPSLQSSHPVRYNGVYETTQPVAEPYPGESRHQIYSERNKYNGPVGRTSDYIPRIDLTKKVDERHLDSRIRNDRHYVIEERKRPAGPIVSNIPEKIVRYETWAADSRIERMSQSAQEQYDLMSKPVYSYASHKRLEAYQNDQKRSVVSNVYREQVPHMSHRYSNSTYPTETIHRDMNDYHANYRNKNPSSSSRQVIQKIPSHNRDLHPHHLDIHSGAQPADKRVLSILRNSLETKHTGFVEPNKVARQIPELIVIDDVDDSVIEITDLTDGDAVVKNNHKPVNNEIVSSLDHHIQMPKAVDSLPRDSDYQRFEIADPKRNTPENDVASRIRTKAELKVMPPSHDSSVKPDSKSDSNPSEGEKIKLLPKSQKQHLFNQIREDNLRLESVIKSEKVLVVNTVPEVKSEPMNIEEIEKDAEIPIKTENILEKLEPENFEVVINSQVQEIDTDWATACDSFMEQLKSGCHKKRIHRRRNDTIERENDVKLEKPTKIDVPAVEVKETVKLDHIPTKEVTETAPERPITEDLPVIEIKQEPVDEDEIPIAQECAPTNIINEVFVDKNKQSSRTEKIKADKKGDKENDKINRNKVHPKIKHKNNKNESSTTSAVTIKKEKDESESESIKTVIKEESESTDDDEPLIKSKILKEKEQTERLKYQLLKDLSEKSAYVKLECCDERMNMNARKSTDSIKDKDEKPANKGKSKHLSRTKGKSSSTENVKNENQNDNSTSDSDDDALSVACRLRVRKSLKMEDNKVTSITKSPVKSSSSKKLDNSSISNCSTPIRKPGFGDGSDFHPGWEEELYRYKRSLRMPTRLIAIPRGRSGGPFVKGSGAMFTRGSTSLPDLDPVPLSPAPSSAPSAATDDYRRPDKLTLDSDLESNSSCSAVNRHYDSEASTSTVFSTTKVRKKGSSIVDVLIQKCGKKEDTKKKSKEKDDKLPKVIPKSSNTSELLPTPSLGLMKNGSKGNLSAKKEKLMEDIFYLGAFRKETVTAFRTAFIKNTDGLMGATEEFAPVVLKSRTRTESRVLKQRATIKEVFGDERPASAPPSCRDEIAQDTEEEQPVLIKKEVETKPKFKSKKIIKDKFKRRSSSIRDGLRSTKSLKRNDAKGRLLRLKKRNSLMKTFNTKRMKDCANNKTKKDKSPSPDDKNSTKDESSSPGTTENHTKKRLKRLFGRRKFSSGFDYIRKKKKIIRRDETCNKIRRPAPKPNPESVHDIQKEIKGWFINKSIGETHLHRAARLGFTDCVAFCLEKMESDPSAKDNAGFTPLHVASAKGHVRIARLLLQYGANVSAAAQGGIRPLHEACENSHVEVIRLLLAYGADPLLGTYGGQTPEELAEGQAALLLRLHIADVQGQAVEPWRFSSPADVIDREELGCDPLSSPPPGSPPPPPDSTIEIQCTEAPLPPFYSLRTIPGQPADGLWCLLQDVTNVLQIKSKESLLKQIHCGSGSPKELLREIRTQEFLERAQCHQLLGAGEKVNVRASKVALVRVTDKLRQLLKIETVLVS
ncbi:uncharacterized protein [Epargyreus clarus]|uniref:uncharacterized protein n=1 Tax=Epargyreus clarus TaxID=520877 RepID=UPI003C2C966A